MRIKIAIIGTGFAGLATCWYLSQHKHVEVTLIDKKLVDCSASAVAMGLLHPYGGARAHRTHNATAGMEASAQLINAAEKALGHPVAWRTGILRPALTAQQLQFFQEAVELNTDVVWWDAARCLKSIPYLHTLGGLFIPGGMTLQAADYLHGLWQACQKRGVQTQIRTVHALAELRDYDQIVVAAGSGTQSIPELAHLPIHLVKGQIIELAWPAHLPPLPFSLSSRGHIVMRPGNRSCLIGATYERQYETSAPDREGAEQELRPRAEALIPALKDAPFLSLRAGLRAFSPNKLSPIVRLIPDLHPPTWVITALGSKGLIQHGWLAKELAERIMHSFA